MMKRSGVGVEAQLCLHKKRVEEACEILLRTQREGIIENWETSEQFH